MKFKRNEDADCASVQLGELYIAPTRLRELFGEPSSSHSDGYKVSGGYTFEAVGESCCVKVYDYKETNLYESSNPSPNEFWSSSSEQQFSVEGDDNNVAVTDAFIAWIHKQ